VQRLRIFLGCARGGVLNGVKKIKGGGAVCEVVLKVHELHEFSRIKIFSFFYHVDYQNKKVVLIRVLRG
jgi:hypothetical protein